MPLGDEGWRRVALKSSRWDTDDCLGDAPDTGDGLRRPLPRIPLFVLDRWETAARGFEGDLTLGLHAGETIASGL